MDLEKSGVTAFARDIAGGESGTAAVKIDAVALLGKRAAACPVELQTVDITNISAGGIVTFLPAAIRNSGVELFLIHLLLRLKRNSLTI